VDSDSYWARVPARALSRRRLLTAAGAGATAAALAACSSRGTAKPAQGGAQPSSQGAGGTPKAGGNFSAYVTSNPTLSPHVVQGVTNTGIAGVMSRLFTFKTGTDPNVSANHQTEGDLAVSAESPDAITWTIKLRPDAKFQNIPPVNGHPVEAEDIIATFTHALDPSVPNPNRGGLNMIDLSQVQTPDKQTLIFKLNFPYSPFPNLLADGYYGWIYPREGVTGGYDATKVAIGSGPFLLDTATPDVAFTYKRNPDYFLKGIPHLDTFKYAIVPDNSQQLAQFTGGNLDELLLGDPFNVPTAQNQNPKAMVLKVPNAGPNPLYFQMGDPQSIFQDIRVRRAVSIAIDRTAIAKAVYNDESEEMVWLPGYFGQWAPRVSELPADSQQWYKYDPKQTKQLLEAAGQPNPQLKIAFPNTFENSVFQKQVETIANMLTQAGIHIDIVVQDYVKDFIGPHGSRNGNFPRDTMMYVAIAPFSDPDSSIYSYFHSKSTANQEKLNDPKLDAMIDHERTLVNEAERQKAIRDIVMYLGQQLYAPSTVGTFQWVFVQARVQNYQYSVNTIPRATETYSKLGVTA
jgi:peptide/nickel transport system substrate-binding protein